MSFVYSSGTLDALHASISSGRLAPYIDAGDGTVEAAVRLYELNARLSAAFYSPLQTLEVTVRNAIDQQFRATFGENWATSGAITLQQQQQDDIQKAINELSLDDQGRPRDFTHDDIVAELNFGFWVGVLGPKNEVEVWRKSLWRAFPHRPKGTERKAVQGALNSIRRLRNRVAHHCRIIHRDLAADHSLILEVIEWICPDTRNWAAALSTFDVNDIPVPEDVLPMPGLPEAAVDEIVEVKKTKPEPTRSGRTRLGVRTKAE